LKRKKDLTGSTASCYIPVFESTRERASVHANLEMNRIMPPARKQSLLAFRTGIRARSSRAILKPIRTWPSMRSYSRPTEFVARSKAGQRSFPAGTILRTLASLTVLSGSLYWVSNNGIIRLYGQGRDKLGDWKRRAWSRFKPKRSEGEHDEESKTHVVDSLLGSRGKVTLSGQAWGQQRVTTKT
jgi:hypothetical protein